MVSPTPRSCQYSLSPPPFPKEFFVSILDVTDFPRRNLRRYCTCGPMLYVMPEAAEVASDPIDMAVPASGSA